MKKYIIGVVILAAIGSIGYVVMSRNGDEDSGPATVTVTRESLVEKALATGEIVPRHEVSVKSKISGTVAHLFVAEGDLVEAGDKLLEVRPDPTPMEYAQAKRALELRELIEKQRHAELQRTQGLLDKGMISQADLERAQENFEQAELQRQMAEEQLAILDEGKAIIAGRMVETIITSPIGGRVLTIDADVGDPVVPLTSYQPGTELIRLADMDDLLFEGTVDEIDVGKIEAGMPVELKVGAYPDSLVEGRLARIALQSQKRESATVFEVEIDITRVPDGVLLRAGYSANADIIVRRVDDVLALPERALLFRGDTTYVRLPPVDAEATPEEQDIEIGMSDGLTVEVVAGLDSGDVVLDKEIREIE
ncbi:MAG: efflux RND transporter periplasmic adaptor subunit [Gemmatimonadetes bacterium]|jgi:HlyD family secretion protein|nr:efflux RND transporter periplasmic adaptor subunit [Gemmatimonadota bacterium]MBT6147033.1 efflux RND transporter periplasmic adaptor subunit [Gemmatimonadota bacterium]MBT7863448.1 efflux RND transporter periplasmic adaptor subunit [Gemmatimonadota bacterium]